MSQCTLLLRMVLQGTAILIQSVFSNGLKMPPNKPMTSHFGLRWPCISTNSSADTSISILYGAWKIQYVLYITSLFCNLFYFKLKAISKTGFLHSHNIKKKNLQNTQSTTTSRLHTVCSYVLINTGSTTRYQLLRQKKRSHRLHCKRKKLIKIPQVSYFVNHFQIYCQNSRRWIGNPCKTFHSLKCCPRIKFWPGNVSDKICHSQFWGLLTRISRFLSKRTKSFSMLINFIFG